MRFGFKFQRFLSCVYIAVWSVDTLLGCVYCAHCPTRAYQDKRAYTCVTEWNKALTTIQRARNHVARSLNHVATVNIACPKDCLKPHGNERVFQNLWPCINFVLEFLPTPVVAYSSHKRYILKSYPTIFRPSSQSWKVYCFKIPQRSN